MSHKHCKSHHESKSCEDIDEKTLKLAKKILENTEKSNELEKQILANVLADIRIDLSIKKDTQALLDRQCILITSIPPGGYYITNPGCYEFDENLTFTGAVAITVTVGNVSINGKNFRLTLDPSSTGILADGTGMSDGINSLIIKNLEIVSSAQNPVETSRSIQLINCPHYRLENVYTARTWRGIEIIDSANGRWYKVTSEFHNVGNLSDGATHSLALRLGGLCHNTSFFDCKWKDNTLPGEFPWLFNDSDGIEIVGFLGPFSEVPVLFNLLFKDCQFLNTNFFNFDAASITFDTCHMYMDIPWPYPIFEVLESMDKLIFKDCTIISQNSSFVMDLLGLFDTHMALIENCVIESQSTGVGDPTSPWPVSFASCISIGGIRNGNSVTVRGCQISGGPADTTPISIPKQAKVTETKSVKSEIVPRLSRWYIHEQRKRKIQRKPLLPIPKSVRDYKPNKLNLVPKGRCSNGIYVDYIGQGVAVTIEDNAIAHLDTGLITGPPQTPDMVYWYNQIQNGAIILNGCQGSFVSNNKITDVRSGGAGRGPGNGIVVAGAYNYYGFQFGVVVLTTAPYTQPNVGDTVSVQVDDSDFLPFILNFHGTIFIANGGYYQLISIDSKTQITVQNLGTAGNAAPGTIIPSGSQVYGATLVPNCLGCVVDNNRVTLCDGVGILDGTPAGNNMVVNNIARQNAINYQIPEVATIVTPGAPAVAGQNLQ